MFNLYKLPEVGTWEGKRQSDIETLLILQTKNELNQSDGTSFLW